MHKKHIRIPCPACCRALRVRPEHVGRRVQCKHCEYVFQISKYQKVTCPTCQFVGRVRTEYSEKRVRCKSCGSNLSAIPSNFRPAVAQDSHSNSAPALGTSRAGSEGSWPPQAQMVDWDLEVSQLRTQLEAMAGERNEAVQRLEGTEEQIRRFQDLVKELQGCLAEAHEQRQQDRAGIVELEVTRAQLEEAKAEQSSLLLRANAVQDLESEREGLQAELDRIGGALQQAREAEAASACERDAAVARRDQIEQELAETRALLEQAQATSETPSPEEGQDPDRDEGEVRALAEEIEALRAERDELDHALAEAAVQRAAAEIEAGRAAEQARKHWEGEYHQTIEKARQQWEAEHREALEQAQQRRDEEHRQALEQAQRRWEDERQALTQQGNPEHVARLQETEQRLREQQAELDRLGEALREAREAEPEAERQRESAQARCGQLEEELHEVLIQLEQARVAHEALSAEVEVGSHARAHVEAQAEELEGLRAQVAELEQALTDAIERQSTVEIEAAQMLENAQQRLEAEYREALAQARRHWESERRGQDQQGGREHAARLQEAELLLRQHQAETAAERQGLLDRLEAERLRSEREAQALREQVEQLGRDAAAAAQDRDDARRRAVALEASFAQVVAERDALEAVRHQRAESPEPVADGQQAELQAARAQVEALCRDIALGQWAGLDAAPAHPMPPTSAPAGHEPTASGSQERVDELTRQLQKAHGKIGHLRSALEALGVKV